MNDISCLVPRNFLVVPSLYLHGIACRHGDNSMTLKILYLQVWQGSSLCLVTVLPSIAPFSFGDTAVNAGKIVQQNCLVTDGDEPLKITWLLNGGDASNSTGVTVFKLGSRTSILTIESVRSYHAGNYTCTATNSAGSSSFTAVLAVNGIRLSVYQSLLHVMFVFGWKL